MSSIDAQIQKIVDPVSSVVDGGRSLIVLNHLAQMKMFGIRQGIEFFPKQDDRFGSRKRFIDDITKHNSFDIIHDRLWDLFLCLGQVAFFFKPNKKGLYDISFYNAEQFRDYYDEDGNLTRAVIIYSYEVQSRGEYSKKKRWIRLIITKESIAREDFDAKPAFDTEFMVIARKEYRNSLGFIPVVVSKNNPIGKGQRGVGEFERFQERIDAHEEALAAMHENLQLFGSPVLLTTQAAGQVTELAGVGSRNLTRAQTASSNSGWYGSNSPSTRNSLPRHRAGVLEGLRVKKVIGGVGPEDKFQFLQVDPVTADQARMIVEEREAIHFALGGIDETGIHANATAYEMKVVYGKVATTAKKKAMALYTHGLCKVLEQMIAAEEELFRRSLAAQLGRQPEELSDGEILQMIDEGTIPQGVIGLPISGDREVQWRWTGPVFEDSPDDLQRRSIVARNLQELGVRSLEALRTLYPEQTEAELKGKLSGGYPFRYINSVAGTTGQLLGLYQQMLSVPSQEDPSQVMAGSLPVQPMIGKSLETIFNELNYARPDEPPSPADDPYITGGSDYLRYRTLLDAMDNPSILQSAGLLPGGGADAGGSGTGSLPIPTDPRNAPAGVQPIPPNGVPPTALPQFNDAVPYAASPLAAAGILPATLLPPLPGSPGSLSAINASIPPGQPQSTNGISPTATGTTPSPIGRPYPTIQQPMAGGIQGSNQLPEYASGLPAPGSVVDRTNVTTLSTGQPTTDSYILPDLLVEATQPDSVWRQLFPTLSKLLPKPKPDSGKPTKSKSGKSGKRNPSRKK